MAMFGASDLFYPLPLLCMAWRFSVIFLFLLHVLVFLLPVQKLKHWRDNVFIPYYSSYYINLFLGMVASFSILVLGTSQCVTYV
jgi:hypothetical protein